MAAAVNQRQRTVWLGQCGWASMALCSVKGIIEKATHCEPGMMLWKSQNDKGRKQTTLLAGPAGRVRPQSNRGGFQDNKIVLCPIFGRYYTTVCICYNQWSGFWERIYFPMFIFHLSIYVSQKENPIDRNCLKWILGRWFFVFLFLSLVLWLHVFPEIFMYLYSLPFCNFKRWLIHFICFWERILSTLHILVERPRTAQI